MISNLKYFLYEYPPNQLILIIELICIFTFHHLVFLFNHYFDIIISSSLNPLDKHNPFYLLILFF